MEEEEEAEEEGVDGLVTEESGDNSNSVVTGECFDEKDSIPLFSELFEDTEDMGVSCGEERSDQWKSAREASAGRVVSFCAM